MDAADWNARYDTAELIWKGDPNQFLPAEVAELPVGTALDLACGEGRNAVWLATRGWRVTGVDFAEVGLAKAARLASDHGVEGTWITADATEWTPPAEGFDLVIIFYLQLPAAELARALRTAVAALAPGGTLLLVAHDLLNLTEGVGGPQDAAVLTTAEAVVDGLAAAELALGCELVIERSGRLERVVTTPEGDRTALDTIVRARRMDAGV
ncbi:MAG: class I SAM-dependent methyltransferase [Acidobacteria bacterium]|nr:class I SAM-dependent methyltransferase [Acidobacteriota bacterium]